MGSGAEPQKTSPGPLSAVLGIVQEQDAAARNHQGGGGQEHLLVQAPVPLSDGGDAQGHSQQGEEGGAPGVGVLEGKAGGVIPGHAGGDHRQELPGEGQHRGIGGVAP